MEKILSELGCIILGWYRRVIALLLARYFEEKTSPVALGTSAPEP